MISSDSSAQINAIGNTMQIKKGTLLDNQIYIVSCSASKQYYCGQVAYTYTTIRSSTVNAIFGVTPTYGYAMDTEFVYQLNKTSAAKSKCEYGYINNYSNALILLSTGIDQENATQNNETFTTFLPGVQGGNLTVYAKCVDEMNL